MKEKASLLRFGCSIAIGLAGVIIGSILEESIPLIIIILFIITGLTVAGYITHNIWLGWLSGLIIAFIYMIFLTTPIHNINSMSYLQLLIGPFPVRLGYFSLFGFIGALAFRIVIFIVKREDV